MPMLCDVNVLLALVTDRHAAHTAAVRWLDGVPAGEATICRMAQTGLLRLLNNPDVMREEVLDPTACASAGGDEEVEAQRPDLVKYLLLSLVVNFILTPFEHHPTLAPLCL